MVTHPTINLGHGCFTSVIWPFTITAFTFGLLLFQRDNRAPNLNASIMPNTSMSQHWGQWEWMARSLRLGTQDHGGHFGMHFAFFQFCCEKLKILVEFSVLVMVSKNSYIPSHSGITVKYSLMYLEPTGVNPTTAFTSLYPYVVT